MLNEYVTRSMEKKNIQWGYGVSSIKNTEIEHNKVYLLQHNYEVDGSDYTKIIGIYSTREKAEAVKEHYSSLRGFKRYPESFFIDVYVIDKNHWVEGF